MPGQYTVADLQNAVAPPVPQPSGPRGQYTLADLADAPAKQPGFWDSYGKQITTNSPLNPSNWGAMIRSAFDSPFSEEHMAEAERQAEIFRTGKAPELQPGEAESMAGEGAGHLTNAVIMGLLSAGVMKGYNLAADHADIVAGAAKGAWNGATEPLNVKGLVIPGGKVAAAAGTGGYLASKVGLPSEVGAVAGAAAPVVRGAIEGVKGALSARASALRAAAARAYVATPEWMEHPDIAPEAPPQFQATPATALPSGRIPGNMSPPVQMPDVIRDLARKGLLRTGQAATPEPVAPQVATLVASAPQVATPVETTPVPEPEPEPSMESVELQRHPAADANRVKAADRWASTLKAVGVVPPPITDEAAWTRLSQNLGERRGYTPAPDTRQMILERMAIGK